MSNESFLSKLERKWGRYAIRNLTTYLCAMYAIGYVLMLFTNGMSFLFFNLDMSLVMKGQIWRLFTFLLIPPDYSILVIITILFYWSIGTSMEQTWGTFYYNVYMIGGILFTWIGTFLGWVVSYLITGESNAIVGSSYYLLMSLFLAFALMYPDHQILFMFIIPLKVKYLAYFYYVLMAYEIFQYVKLGAWGYVISIVVSLFNFFLFFRATRKRTRPSRKQMKRRREFEARTKMINPKGITRHKCAVCGATEESDPTLEFRFCSKCKGNYEYCQNHLFTHQHVN